jgi:hypothetical protein
MNRCAICGQAIEDKDLIVHEVRVSRQMHWEPAEYNDVTLHHQCLERQWWAEAHGEAQRWGRRR